jgi:hypothetical protein
LMLISSYGSSPERSVIPKSPLSSRAFSGAPGTRGFCFARDGVFQRASRGEESAPPTCCYKHADGNSGATNIVANDSRLTPRRQ